MRSDQVFVLLLIILIPMTGCFDNSVGDAEGAQDDPADDNSGLPDVTTDSGGSGTDQTSSQERIWYSTGETIPTTWHDGMTVNYNGEITLNMGHCTTHLLANILAKNVEDMVTQIEHRIGMSQIAPT